MKHHHHLFLAFLASYPTSSICADTTREIQRQEAPNAQSSTTITAAGAEGQFTTTFLAPPPEESERTPSPAPIAKRYQARQHMVAARTTSEVVTSITTLPAPAPTTESTTSSGDGDNNETSIDDGAEDPSSTITITVTSNRTTTIRPTVTVTSLFSSVGSTTSGARGRLEPSVSIHG